MDQREWYGKGLEVRRAVLGDAHVDRTLKTKTPFNCTGIFAPPRLIAEESPGVDRRDCGAHCRGLSRGWRRPVVRG